MPLVLVGGSGSSARMTGVDWTRDFGGDFLADLLAGGLLTGSKVYADWRGLKKEQLFEGRDLPTTIDLAAVYARVLERVFGLSPSAIQEQVMAHRPHAALKGLLGLG